ncbi:Transcriptional activator HAP5 [Yarrowia sp. B02]|nr:Transcriptional activator HAP5 [Yarrowia sp. B02]
MENTEGYIEEREGDLEYDRMMEYDQGAEGEHEHEHGAADNGLDQMTGTFNNVAQGLSGHYRSIMLAYWQEIISSIEHDEHEFKVHQLPLARIKKVMKADEDVKMISAEAPILFAKGCDIFITELSMRAWIHAEEHKRRTLQRSDIASALQRSDMFDFLIDIVPREEATLPPGARSRQNQSAAAAAAAAMYMGEDEDEYLQESLEEGHLEGGVPGGVPGVIPTHPLQEQMGMFQQE